MNIRINVELTPEEMRRLVGLPDVQSFNNELMNQMRERMLAGVEGYDPLTLFQPYVTTTMAGMDVFRKLMANAMTGFSMSEKTEEQ